MTSLKALLRRLAWTVKRDFQELQGGEREICPVRSLAGFRYHSNVWLVVCPMAL
jgi:hypothetical protein